MLHNAEVVAHYVTMNSYISFLCIHSGRLGNTNQWTWVSNDPETSHSFVGWNRMELMRALCGIGSEIGTEQIWAEKWVQIKLCLTLTICLPGGRALHPKR